MAPKLAAMAPFLIEYAGLKYLTKFLIVRVNKTKVLLFSTKLLCLIHFYH